MRGYEGTLPSALAAAHLRWEDHYAVDAAGKGNEIRWRGWAVRSRELVGLHERLPLARRGLLG